jgi:quercetin dioxygenase-like cupin family protein
MNNSMDNAPKEIIPIGQLEIRFLLDGADTSNRLCMFEFVVPARAKVPAPHYHVAVDEVVYGLEGILTFTVGGVRHELGPGAKCFVPRGVVHGFENGHDQTAKALAVLTPASIGPAYFRETAAIINAGGPPDIEKVKAVMRRHGLEPAPMPRL